MVGEGSSGEKADINTIFEGLYSQAEEKESSPCTLFLKHEFLSENMILALF